MLTLNSNIFAGIAQPQGDWQPDDLATVGELLLDISINLARTYVLYQYISVNEKSLIAIFRL